MSQLQIKMNTPRMNAAVLILLLAGFGPVQAGERADALKEGADAVQKDWSNKVLKLANGLDSFFGDSRIEDDAQQTRIKLRFDLEHYESEGLDARLRASARLSLPRTENKLALIVNGDDLEDDEQSLEDEQEREVSLRYDATSSLTRNLSYDAGFRRPDDRYEPYLRARYRRNDPLGQWVSRLDNKLYYYSRFGFEYDGKLDFDRVLPPSVLFRSHTRLRWWENDDKCNGGFCPEQHFLFYQRMKNPAHALAYEASSYFESEPVDGSTDHLKLARLQLRYRHRTPWEWAFVELRPAVDFPRDEDYEPTWNIMLRLEAIFGYRPKYDTLEFGPEEALR